MFNNDCAITLVAGSEDDDLEVFCELPETFNCVWSNVNACFGTITIGKHNRQDHIMWDIDVFVAVYQSFIEVEDYCVQFGGFWKLPYWLNFLRPLY